MWKRILEMVVGGLIVEGARIIYDETKDSLKHPTPPNVPKMLDGMPSENEDDSVIIQTLIPQLQNTLMNKAESLL